MCAEGRMMCERDTRGLQIMCVCVCKCVGGGCISVSVLKVLHCMAVCGTLL